MDLVNDVIPWLKDRIKDLQAERNEHGINTKEFRRLYLKINQHLDTLEVLEGYVRGQMGTDNSEGNRTRA